jgi:hypothetical protein
MVRHRTWCGVQGSGMDPEALRSERPTLIESNDQQPETTGEQQQENPSINIEMTREGLKLMTNVRNPIMQFGLLELAKQTFVQAHAKANESPIARVPFLPPGLNLRQ